MFYEGGVERRCGAGLVQKILNSRSRVLDPEKRNKKMAFVKKNSWVVLVAVLGLMVISGIAFS
jgi:hypothetical protein